MKGSMNEKKIVTPKYIQWNDLDSLKDILVGRRIVESINNNYHVVFRRKLDNGDIIDIFDGIDGDVSTDGCDALGIPVLGIGSGDRWQGEDAVITNVRLVYSKGDYKDYRNRNYIDRIALVADYEGSTISDATLDLIDCDSPDPDCPFIVVYYPSE